jgi:hypothetical protein
MKKIFFLFGFLFLITACNKNSESDKLSEAQDCLDKATSSTVSQCMEKVSGIESAGAYLIRCSALFIADGFDDPTRLTSAFNNMTNTGTGTSGTDASLQVMGALAFKNGSSATVNQTNANLALNYCEKSGSKGLILLSGIASMATNMLALASCGTDINCALSNAQSNTTTQAAVGAAAIAAYTANCTAGQTSNQQFCNQFSSAVTSAGGTSNSTAVGAALIQQYCATKTGGC